MTPAPTDTQLVDQLRELLPAPPGPDGTEEILRRVGGRLPAQLEDRPTTSPTRHRRPLRAVGWAVAAAVAALVVVQVAAPDAGRDGKADGQVAAPPAARDTRAVAALARVATVAQVGEPVPVGPDQQVYVRSVVRTNTGALGARPRLGPPHEREVWTPQAAQVPADDQGRIREGGKTIPIGSGTAGTVAAGLRRPTYDWLAALPQDPSALLATLRREVVVADGQDRDQAVFDAVGDLLSETLAPPGTTAALYRVAARVPGVRLVPGVVDLAGRPGVGITRDDPGTLVRSEWVFDPRTSAFLGSLGYLEEAGHERLFSSVAVLSRGVVDRAGERPTG